MRVEPYGARAVLITPDAPADVPALRSYAATRPGVVDAVAGAETVLAVFATAVPAVDWTQFGSSDVERPQRTVELPVSYDGADLASVAEHAGVSTAEVVAFHTATEYTVRFCGFSPGFGYLDGLDPRLHVPRHRSPRTSVPAGSVAIAGAFTGVYPRSSPGGWQLIGRTDAVLWDVRRDPPALLTPGTRVRFVRR